MLILYSKQMLFMAECLDYPLFKSKEDRLAERLPSHLYFTVRGSVSYVKG